MTSWRFVSTHEHLWLRTGTGASTNIDPFTSWDDYYRCHCGAWKYVNAASSTADWNRE